MSVEDSRRIQFKNLKQMIDLGAVSQITGLSQVCYCLIFNFFLIYILFIFKSYEHWVQC